MSSLEKPLETKKGATIDNKCDESGKRPSNWSDKLIQFEYVDLQLNLQLPFRRVRAVPTDLRHQ